MQNIPSITEVAARRTANTTLRVMLKAAGITGTLLEAVEAGRDTLTTGEAAAVVNRRSQTLRRWACLEDGPIRPVRINGRLAWKVSDLAHLLTGEVA